MQRIEEEVRVKRHLQSLESRHGGASPLKDDFLRVPSLHGEAHPRWYPTPGAKVRRGNANTPRRIPARRGEGKRIADVGAAALHHPPHLSASSIRAKNPPEA